MSLLPGDVIFDILSRTPVKSVCRFRCVSKDWLALISDPAFLAAHHSRTDGDPQLLVTGYHGEGSRVLLLDTEGNAVRKITEGLGTYPSFCSTLGGDFPCVVCCADEGIIRAVDLVSGKLLLTCPAPGKREILALGVGAAGSGSGSYKAVRLVQRFPPRYGDPEQICEVLTLGGDGGGWRQAKPPPAQLCLDLCFLQGVVIPATVLNGVAHFRNGSTAAAGMHKDSVLRFDLGSEEWADEPIHGPLGAHPGLWAETRQIRVAQLGGALCMVQTELAWPRWSESGGGHRCTNVWLLRAGGSGGVWVKAYAVPAAVASEIMEPLMVMPDGVKLLFYDYLREDKVRVVRAYDPRDGTCTEVMRLPTRNFGKIGLCRFHLYNFVAPITKI